MSNYNIVPMLIIHQWEISTWKYDDIYSFYNRPTLEQPTTNSNVKITDSFIVQDNSGNIIGHFHFGSDAQIPTIENYNYTNDYLDIGLGLRPDLCGHGNGIAFTSSVIEFAKRYYNATKFRLSVAQFNIRAQKVYKKMGFTQIAEVTNSYFHNKFYIMTLD